MQRFRSAALTTAAVVLVLGVSACAPGVLAPGASTAATPSATPVETESPDPSATPVETESPNPEESPSPSVVETQNSTASFGIPVGWTVVDDSAVTSTDGGEMWGNVVSLLDAAGNERAVYSDGGAADVDAGVEQHVVATADMLVEAMAEQYEVVAWWYEADGLFVPQAGLVQAGVENRSLLVQTPDSERTASFSVTFEAVPECADLTSAAAVEACLASADVAEAMDVITSLWLEPAVPIDAMPWMP